MFLWLRRFLVMLGLLCLMTACATIRPCPTPKVPLPNARAFAKTVLSLVKTYPTDGTHPYWWPKNDVWHGVTRDVMYEGKLVAKGDPKGRCYCCGLTWEVFMRAIEEYNNHHWRKVLTGWTTDQVDDLRVKWFGSDGNKECIRNAVLSYGIGFEIKDRERAKPGDFIQLWRFSGSGHSVIFDSWVHDDKGAITGLKYWSTQPTTDGIGYAQEPVGGDKGIDLDHTYILRIGRGKP